MRYGRFCSLVVFLVAVAAPANGHISGGDSYLHELGLPRGALLLSLFGFNVGVEVGQMAIVALALLFAYAWRRHWMYRHVALTFGSAATAGMAFLWFVERTFDVPSLLPSAPEADPRAAFTHVAPYLLPQIRHPLVVTAGMPALLDWPAAVPRSYAV